MATLVLQVAGGALGTAVAGPAGALAGRALGAIAGAAVDSSLLSAFDARKAGQAPALADAPALISTEGAPVPKVFGRARVGGQLIWATRIERAPVFSDSRSGLGGKGALAAAGGDGKASWAFYANIAVGVCEGPVAFIRRVWADGEELDLSAVTMRVHAGGEDQQPDPLVAAKEGAENAPAWRGLAYVVFERLPLARFGDRIPQFSFEVVRPLNGLCGMIRAVCLIPGASEHGLDPLWRVQTPAPGVSQPENRNQLYGVTDVVASLDALQALCPKLERVALVVSWFGDDLRAGSCTIRPRVESHDKVTTGDPWMAAGQGRALTPPVSRHAGRPACGGTPSDAAVIRLIQELARRGLAVTLYPFVMMDIPGGNGLPDPRDPEREQPPYPWRGRMTCHPAPGVPGSPDGTADADAQIARFFGDAAPEQFLPWFATVLFTGAPQWSYRRFILHYATLASMAGHVSAFVIGSEFVGLTRTRGENGYPAAEQFAALAADVRAILGSGPHIVYAADWTEYGAHVRNGGADVDFPLDVVWASPDVDAVGIDYYPPLSDWRDGDGHPDASLAPDIYDLDYLTGRLAAGEAFDWYYPDEAARLAGARAPIADGAWGKPWVFRAKDLVAWWSQPHVRRAGGVETTQTAWVPGGKPLWLTEAGVPAVDRGTNGPNVFPDAKSSENATPPFSRGWRDDMMQLRGLQAVIRRFDPEAGASDDWNPPASLYPGRMVDPAHIYVWAWDARPFPAFPALRDVWGDAASWWSGHWITGRLEGVELDMLLRRLLAEGGVEAEPGPPAVNAFLDGYVVDRPMSAREALQPLCDLYGVTPVASGGRVRLAGPRDRPVMHVDAGMAVPDADGAPFELIRAEETALPREIRLGFTDSDGDYRRAVAMSRRLAGASLRQGGAELAIALHRGEAGRLADAWLQRVWSAMDRLSLRLSPRMLALEPGDVFTFDAGEGARPWRVTRILDGEARQIEAESCARVVADAGPARTEPLHAAPPPAPGPPLPVTLDLPVAAGEPVILQHLAVFADPWPGRMTLWRASGDGHFSFLDAFDAPALLGETTTPLPPGPLWRFDRGPGFEALARGGALASVDDAALFDGANLFALIAPDGEAEIIAAGRIELAGAAGGARLWRFSRLLRGLAGSEPAASRFLAAGARVVALDGAVRPLCRERNDIGRALRYRIGPAGRDHGDPGFTEFTATPGALALRPMPPVHLRARRTAEGVRISFIPRGRRAADAWDGPDPPRDDGERYDVEIRAGDAVARTLTGTEPPLLYPAAAELADFGAPQTTLDLAVTLASAAGGRSFPTRALVPVR